MADETQVSALADALRPFVAAYQREAEPIGDSDLYDEQPRRIPVTLGDCRKAARVLAALQQAQHPTASPAKIPERDWLSC